MSTFGDKRVLTFDAETRLFGPGNMAPPIVCLSYAYRDDSAKVQSGLLAKHEIVDWLAPKLEHVVNGDLLVANQSISYDMMCLLEHYQELEDLIWEAYAVGGVLCTRVREKLLDIGEGNHGGEINYKGERVARQYDLADMVLRHFKRNRDKETWRTSYAELESTPIEQWPPGAREYALDDSTDALDVFELQERRAHEMRYTLPDQTAQTRTDFALRLMSAWGVRTDGKSVEKLAKITQTRFQELKVELQEGGLVRRRRMAKNGSRLIGKESKNMVAIRAMVERSYAGPALPYTKASKKHPAGQIKTDADTLEFCDDPIADVLHEYVGLEKSATSFIDKLRAGVHAPIHCNYNILVNSGRTSASKPNMQQQPRVPGVRECFVPDMLIDELSGEELEGKVFVACDYDSQELRAWAQVCLDLLGESTLAAKYQADPAFDPHLDFASGMLRIDYAEGLRRKKAGDEQIKDVRQKSKPANFGFPVGMGYKKFRKYARGYNLRLTEEESKELRGDWYNQWPEAKPYFAEINRIVGSAGYGTVIQLRSGRRRGLCRYTVAANTFFQGLAADASKLALWRAAWECYHNPSSALYGCRPVIFAHDEIIMTAPESYAHEAAMALQELMVAAMEEYVPDVPVRASSVLMRRWAKGAEPAWKDGRLVPYEDLRVAA